MDWRTVDLTNCPVTKALDVIGQRWTLLLLREAFNGVRRFDDLCEHLDVPRASLARRLRELTEAGLFERVPYRDEGARERHEYRPTAMAWGLYPVLVGLMQWGDTWFNDGEPPLRLVERSTGEPVRAAVVAGRVEELAPTSVRWEAGPSFHTIEERRRAPRKRAATAQLGAG
jgi:DNA-binding HxlR family transcriptional regulator